MKGLLPYLGGGDLRSIGRSSQLMKQIKTQEDFDAVFRYLQSSDRLVVMRAADVLEKVSRLKPHWLAKHKKALIKMLSNASDKELKWHLALMCPRLPLNSSQVESVWAVLSTWALDNDESKIVRVNSMQGLSDLTSSHKECKSKWLGIMSKIETEKIPSLKARLRKLAQ